MASTTDTPVTTPGEPDYKVAAREMRDRLFDLGIHAEFKHNRDEPLGHGMVRRHWSVKVMHRCKLVRRDPQDVRVASGDWYEVHSGTELMTSPYFHGSKVNAFGRAKERPTVVDVMSCLVRDADAIDHADYESWASELGYDTDSRKGEATYRACLEIGLKLRAALGETVLNELRELANRL